MAKAGLVDSGIVSQSSNHETNSTTQVLELEELRYWWESSSSSILSIHSDEAETRDVCDAVRKAISSTSAEQKAPTPLVYVNCVGITSADILRYVVAKLTLSSQEPWKVWDTIISEYRVKQAFAEVKGQEVSPMNAQECLNIILNVAAASPVTLLLDQVQTQSIRQLLSSLVYAVDNSDQRATSLAKPTRRHETIPPQRPFPAILGTSSGPAQRPPPRSGSLCRVPIRTRSHPPHRH